MRLQSLTDFSGLTGLRTLTTCYPLLPLLAYLLTSTNGSLSWQTVLETSLFTGALCVLPGALNMGRWASALWFFVFNFFAALVLFAVLVTGDFPNLATCMAALKTDTTEAGQMLLATKGYAALMLMSWLAQLAGCISFGLKAPSFSFSHSRIRFIPIGLLLLPILSGPVALAYPTNLVSLIMQCAHYQQASDSVIFSDNYRVWKTQPAKSAASAELVVFVIGESSQAEYWQLLGNSQPSTPALVSRQAKGELISFGRHMSTVSVTRLAVPALLSPFSEILPTAQGHRPSLVSLMRRGGYDTAWLSVQGPTPAAAEAGTTHFTGDFEVLGYSGLYDDRLVSKASQWLAVAKAQPGFLVLHTAGSHVPYEARYPEETAYWKDHLGKTFPKSQTVGNYLNSIRYTDAMLDKLMSRLAQEARPVLLVYVADHGDSSMRGYSRDHASVESMMHVPFILWSNAAWQTANPEKWAKLEQLARERVVTSHLNIVPTLTSVLGLEYAGKPHERDLLSPKFTPWTRTPAIEPKTMKQIEVAPVP